MAGEREDTLFWVQYTHALPKQRILSLSQSPCAIVTSFCFAAAATHTQGTRGFFSLCVQTSSDTVSQLSVEGTPGLCSSSKLLTHAYRVSGPLCVLLTTSPPLITPGLLFLYFTLPYTILAALPSTVAPILFAAPRPALLRFRARVFLFRFLMRLVSSRLVSSREANPILT